MRDTRRRALDEEDAETQPVYVLYVRTIDVPVLRVEFLARFFSVRSSFLAHLSVLPPLRREVRCRVSLSSRLQQ